MASYKHIVVLVCLVVLIGKLNGEEATSEPPKKTCDEEVLQLLGQIESAANESQQQVSSAAQNLQSNITAIQEEVKQLLAEVDSKAKQLPSNRSEECTTELPQLLDESALKLCSENANLNIVTQVGQIGNLKGHASQICAICGAEANDCVTSNVSEVQERVKSLQSEISSQIENAQDEAAECTQELRDSAANAISDASANLDSCGEAEE